MRAVLGLGNPGFKYDNTRHNVGFKILDLFLEKHKFKLSPGKGDFFFMQGRFDECDFIIVKPATYMNLSGLAARDIADQFGLNVEDLLVVADDVNLKPGKIRIRQSGGDGGHNGIRSIIYQLESDNFPRLRFGVGNDFKTGEMADYVLSKFNDNILSSIQPMLNFSISLIEEFIVGGTQAMLNLFSKSSQNFTNNSDQEEN